MKLLKVLRSMKETATAGATSAGNIADVRTTIGKPRPVRDKKKKKMKGHGNNPLYVDRGPLFPSFARRVNETASDGSTNSADFSNDFGTDTPRLPSEFGSLDGKKSVGMYGGTDDISLELFNVFITGDSRSPLYTALNQDGLDRKGISQDGDSTVHDPVSISPWDAYIQAQRFIFQDEQEKLNKRDTRASIIRERDRRESARKLTDSMQKAYINSIRRNLHQDDPKAIGLGKGAEEHQDDYGDTDQTVGKDEKKF